MNELTMQMFSYLGKNLTSHFLVIKYHIKHYLYVHMAIKTILNFIMAKKAQLIYRCVPFYQPM